MNGLELRREVSQYTELFKAFELLLGYRRRLGMVDDQLAINLCEFYAIWGAFKIRTCIGSSCILETVPSHVESGVSLGSEHQIPKHEIVESAAQDLLLAIEAREKTAALRSLNEMRVLSFCPTPEQVFGKMEHVTSRARVRTQQIFLVDLALLACELGDYQRASEYIRQARSFNPTSRELYNICVTEGLIALSNGRTDEAIQCLQNSTRACQADVDSSIQCSLLDPNLEIAEKLLAVDARIAVLEYLVACHNVWQLYRPQIEEWIHIVENLGTPDFQIAASMAEVNQLSRRINVQWMRACSLELQEMPSKPKASMSPAQVLAERERRQAENEPRMSAHIKKKLEYLEKDLGG